MENSKSKYLTLFLSTLQLSAFTFGGGFVIIPLMRKKFVEKLHWLDEQEMMDFAAIAQSSPGAIAVNASILIGYRIAGLPGALVTVAGTVLPPLVIITVISFFYAAFRSNPIVSMAMAGMSAGVAAVICDVVYTMGRSVLQLRRVLPAVIMAAAFVAACFFDVSVIVIILLCGAAGAWDTPAPRARKGGRRSMIYLQAFVELFPDRPVQHRRRLRHHAADPAPGGGAAPLAHHDAVFGHHHHLADDARAHRHQLGDLCRHPGRRDTAARWWPRWAACCRRAASSRRWPMSTIASRAWRWCRASCSACAPPWWR